MICPATGRRQGAGRDRPTRSSPKSAPRSGSRSVRCSASSAIFADNRFHPELEDHEQTRHRPRPDHAQGHHRPADRLAQDLLQSRGRAGPARAAPRDRADGRLRRAEPAGVRHHRRLHRQRRRDRRRERAEAHPHRMGQGARRRRGIRRPPDQARRQRQRLGQAPRPQLPQHAEALARARRQAGHAIRMGQGRRHHQGDDLRRRAREPRPQEAARPRRMGAEGRRELRRLGAAVHHAGVRARAKSPAAAPSSRPTSTTPSWSR